MSNSFSSCPRSIFVVWCLFFLSCIVIAQESCTLVGFKEDIREGRPSGCSPYKQSSNVCKGNCLSWSIPASPDELLRNPDQHMITYSRCCTMENFTYVNASIRCNTGLRNISIKSALSCHCDAHGCAKDNP